MVAFFVIMPLELEERFPQRTFPEQDQMGQALLFNRSHPALCKSVQIRAARRQSQTLHPRYCQGLPELSAELGIAIVQQVATAVQMSHPLQWRCKLPDASSTPPDDRRCQQWRPSGSPG